MEEVPSNSPKCPWHRLQLIGSGSHGFVYLAKSDDDSQEFAVKSAQAVYASTIMKEYRIYRDFNNGCPEIVYCYAHQLTIDHGILIYNLLLEYASAGTLSDLIKRTSGLGFPETQVRAFTRMILKGLHFMHSKGYVHCDLKPKNILAFPTEDKDAYRLKLVDFGLAKLAKEKQHKKEWRPKFRGTPKYMSPESVKAGVILPALDVWSLGCTVVSMVTGKRAWHGVFGDTEPSEAEMKEVLMNSNEATPVVPEKLSEEGKDFLSKCLERSYAKRWSARILLQHPFVLLDD